MVELTHLYGPDFKFASRLTNLRGIAEPQVFMQRISWRAEGLRGVAGLRWLYATGPCKTIWRSPDVLKSPKIIQAKSTVNFNYFLEASSHLPF